MSQDINQIKSNQIILKDQISGITSGKMLNNKYLDDVIFDKVMYRLDPQYYCENVLRAHLPENRRHLHENQTALLKAVAKKYNLINNDRFDALNNVAKKGKLWSRFAKLGKFGGPLGAGITLAGETINEFSDENSDNYSMGQHVARVAFRGGGAIAGGLAGAKLGALAGSLVGPAGTIVGGFLGGTAGTGTRRSDRGCTATGPGRSRFGWGPGPAGRSESPAPGSGREEYA